MGDASSCAASWTWERVSYSHIHTLSHTVLSWCSRTNKHTVEHKALFTTWPTAAFFLLMEVKLKSVCTHTYSEFHSKLCFLCAIRLWVERSIISSHYITAFGIRTKAPVFANIMGMTLVSRDGAVIIIFSSWFAVDTSESSHVFLSRNTEMHLDWKLGWWAGEYDNMTMWQHFIPIQSN